MIMEQNKSVAFLVDPIENLDFTSDSTLLIANEFQIRGYKLFYFLPQSLIFEKNQLYANGKYFQIDYEGQHIAKLNSEKVLLENFEIVFIRQIPPFNQQYLTITYLIETLKRTLILNDPRSIRDVTEKLSILNFKDYIPDTMVSSNANEIKDFIERHNVAILKPLYDCAGQGVIKIEYNTQNIEKAIEAIVEEQGYIMLQEYLPNIRDFGDKRVMFLDGEVLGVINRKAKPGEFRVNMIVGGKSYKTSLTQEEQKLCDEVGKFLKDKNLFLVGIDIIDEKLIEINVTSPTGLVAIKNLYGTDVGKIIVDKIETKVKSCYSAN
jgi:glutathione synthase